MITIDIEKLKKEYEGKIECAMLTNELVPQLNEVGIRVNIYKGVKGENVYAFYNDGYLDKLTEYQVGYILTHFVKDEDTEVWLGKNEGNVMLPYMLQCHRYAHSGSELSFVYRIHEGKDEVRFDVPIDNASEEIKQFFMETYRDASDEISNHLSPAEMRYYKKLQYLTFRYGNIVKFHGGYDKQAEEFAINDIVERFKYIYEYAPTEEDGKEETSHVTEE
jgi:hypothetical protein